VTPEELFQALVALPREAGTPASEGARRLLTRYLEALGYSVTRQGFSFQPAVANVLPILGAGLGWLTLLQIPFLLLAALPAPAALLVWTAGLGAVGVLAAGIGTGVRVPGAERREDANLIATRGATPVKRWLVAHLDSKAQGHSLAGRLVALWVLLVGILGMTALAAARWWSGTALLAAPVAAGAAAAMAGGALAARGRLRGTSSGARDNATGVLALAVAARTCREDGVGLLFTGAEEFGLVGARVFAQSESMRPTSEFVNVDTVTGAGPFYILVHDQRGREAAGRLAALLPARRAGWRTRRLPLGILVDSLPLARAGAVAVTLASLGWADLRRVHTPRDTGEGLDLTAAVALGEALAGLR
jgi:Peptidase family M28